jgi:hypothetical protein
MGIDLSKLKSRLNSLSNTSNKTQIIWKPKPGDQVVRIVPYKYQPDNPFIELKFHYGIGGKDSNGQPVNKTYLSPDTFHRPDPIVEFSNRLKKNGSKEDWRRGRDMEPKMRTFVPVIVRGEEGEGVRFWGFGKQVYQDILSVMADPDYGDITDLTNGKDITVTFTTADKTGKNFPETTIRVKPKSTPAVDPTKADLVAAIKNQTNILDLFPEPEYEELKAAMNEWLNPTAPADEVVKTSVVDEESTQPVVESAIATEAPPSKATKSPSATASKANADDLTKAFDNLFNS